MARKKAAGGRRAQGRGRGQGRGGRGQGAGRGEAEAGRGGPPPAAVKAEAERSGPPSAVPMAEAQQEALPPAASTAPPPAAPGEAVPASPAAPAAPQGPPEGISAPKDHREAEEDKEEREASLEEPMKGREEEASSGKPEGGEGKDGAEAAEGIKGAEGKDAERSAGGEIAEGTATGGGQEDSEARDPPESPPEAPLEGSPESPPEGLSRAPSEISPSPAEPPLPPASPPQPPVPPASPPQPPSPSLPAVSRIFLPMTPPARAVLSHVIALDVDVSFVPQDDQQIFFDADAGLLHVVEGRMVSSLALPGHPVWIPPSLAEGGGEGTAGDAGGVELNAGSGMHRGAARAHARGAGGPADAGGGAGAGAAPAGRPPRPERSAGGAGGGASAPAPRAAAPTGAFNSARGAASGAADASAPPAAPDAPPTAAAGGQGGAGRSVPAARGALEGSARRAATEGEDATSASPSAAPLSPSAPPPAGPITIGSAVPEASGDWGAPAELREGGPGARSGSGDRSRGEEAGAGPHGATVPDSVAASRSNVEGSSEAAPSPAPVGAGVGTAGASSASAAPASPIGASSPPPTGAAVASASPSALSSSPAPAPPSPLGALSPRSLLHPPAGAAGLASSRRHPSQRPPGAPPSSNAIPAPHPRSARRFAALPAPSDALPSPPPALPLAAAASPGADSDGLVGSLGRLSGGRMATLGSEGARTGSSLGSGDVRMVPDDSTGSSGDVLLSGGGGKGLVTGLLGALGLRGRATGSGAAAGAGGRLGAPAGARSGEGEGGSGESSFGGSTGALARLSSSAIEAEFRLAEDGDRAVASPARAALASLSQAALREIEEEEKGAEGVAWDEGEREERARREAGGRAGKGGEVARNEEGEKARRDAEGEEEEEEEEEKEEKEEQEEEDKCTVAPVLRATPAEPSSADPTAASAPVVTSAASLSTSAAASVAVPSSSPPSSSSSSSFPTTLAEDDEDDGEGSRGSAARGERDEGREAGGGGEVEPTEPIRPAAPGAPGPAAEEPRGSGDVSIEATKEDGAAEQSGLVESFSLDSTSAPPPRAAAAPIVPSPRSAPSPPLPPAPPSLPSSPTPLPALPSLPSSPSPTSSSPLSRTFSSDSADGASSSFDSVSSSASSSSALSGSSLSSTSTARAFLVSSGPAVLGVSVSPSAGVTAIRRSSRLVEVLDHRRGNIFVEAAGAPERPGGARPRKAPRLLGLFWVASEELAMVTDRGVEHHRLMPNRLGLKLVAFHHTQNVQWYAHDARTRVLALGAGPGAERIVLSQWGGDAFLRIATLDLGPPWGGGGGAAGGSSLQTTLVGAAELQATLAGGHHARAALAGEATAPAGRDGRAAQAGPWAAASPAAGPPPSSGTAPHPSAPVSASSPHSAAPAPPSFSSSPRSSRSSSRSRALSSPSGSPRGLSRSSSGSLSSSSPERAPPPPPERAAWIVTLYERAYLAVAEAGRLRLHRLFRDGSRLSHEVGLPPRTRIELSVADDVLVIHLVSLHVALLIDVELGRVPLPKGQGGNATTLPWPLSPQPLARPAGTLLPAGPPPTPVSAQPCAPSSASSSFTALASSLGGLASAALPSAPAALLPSAWGAGAYVDSVSGYASGSYAALAAYISAAKTSKDGADTRGGAEEGTEGAQGAPEAQRAQSAQAGTGTESEDAGKGAAGVPSSSALSAPTSSASAAIVQIVGGASAGSGDKAIGARSESGGESRAPKPAPSPSAPRPAAAASSQLPSSPTYAISVDSPFASLPPRPLAFPTRRPDGHADAPLAKLRTLGGKIAGLAGSYGYGAGHAEEAQRERGGEGHDAKGGSTAVATRDQIAGAGPGPSAEKDGKESHDMTATLAPTQTQAQAQAQAKVPAESPAQTQGSTSSASTMAGTQAPSAVASDVTAARAALRAPAAGRDRASARPPASAPVPSRAQLPPPSLAPLSPPPPPVVSPPPPSSRLSVAPLWAPLPVALRMRPRGRAPSARIEVSPGPAPRSAVLAPPAWLAEPRLGVVARLAIDLGAVADTAAGGGIDECCRALAFLQLRTSARGGGGGAAGREGVEALDRAFGLGGGGAGGGAPSRAGMPSLSSSSSVMSPALLQALFSPAPLSSSGEAGLVGDPRHISLIVLWRLVEARAPARHLRAAFDAVNAARRRAKALGREDAAAAAAGGAGGGGEGGVAAPGTSGRTEPGPRVATAAANAPPSERPIASAPLSRPSATASGPDTTFAAAGPGLAPPHPPSPSAAPSLVAPPPVSPPRLPPGGESLPPPLAPPLGAFSPLPSALSSPSASSRAGSALAGSKAAGAPVPVASHPDDPVDDRAFGERAGPSPPPSALWPSLGIRGGKGASASSGGASSTLKPLGAASVAVPALRRDPDLSSHSCSPERPFAESSAGSKRVGRAKAASDARAAHAAAGSILDPRSRPSAHGPPEHPSRSHLPSSSSHRPPTPATVKLPTLGPDIAGTTAASSASPARAFAATPAPLAARKERAPPAEPRLQAHRAPVPLGRTPPSARTSPHERPLYEDAGVGLTPVIVACLLLERAADRLDAAAAAVGLACGQPPRGLPPVPDALLPPPGWPLLTAYALEFVGSLLSFGVAVPPTVGLVVARGLLAQGRAHELRGTLGALPALRSRELADWLACGGGRAALVRGEGKRGAPGTAEELCSALRGEALPVPRPVALPCLPSLAHDLLCSLGDRGAAAELLLRCGRVEEAVRAARHYRLPGLPPGRLALEAASRGRPELLPGLVRVSRAGPERGPHEPRHPSLRDVLRDLDRRFPEVGIATWAEGAKA